MSLRHAAALARKPLKGEPSLSLRLTRLVAFLVLFASITNAHAEPMDSGKRREVDRLFERWDTPTSPGCAMAVMKDGRILYERDSPLMIDRGFFTDESMAAANWIYVKDADATYRRALVAGATSVREPSDYPWGDRVAGVKDSFGNTWWIATHKF
jgi:hypothetical protein